jgi:L-serine dehydratase
VDVRDSSVTAPKEAYMSSSKQRDDRPVLPEFDVSPGEVPSGVDRRTFMMRGAVIGAAAVITGCSVSEKEKQAAAPAPAPVQVPKPAGGLSQGLEVVKQSKGPVMTTIDEFYKIGPGPSSSHTIGPMRITYDFYQRCTKLPADTLAKATGMKVNLFGSLSATGKGHGTERAALAGIIGKEPATINPLFLDELRDKPDQVFPVKLGDKTFNVSLQDIIYDATKGDFPHPNTMTCKLMGGDAVLLEQEYYSVGGGFIEWKGYQPPKKGQPKYPYSTMKELLAHAEQNKLSFAQVVMANEVAVSGKSEAEVNAFIDKVATAMVNIVKTGLKMPPGVLPGPIKLKTKAGEVYKRAMDDKYTGQRGVGVVAAYALAGSEENARGHLVVTAPTGGSAGVMPALVYVFSEGARVLPKEKIRAGFLAAAAIGYLCKHNATLAGAEGGCQAEIGVASAMGAAFLTEANDFPAQVVANAAE